jgi:hypothetical protein
MADITPATIIVRFDRDADQWSAWFADTRQVAFGGDRPVVAMRRLLEGTEAASDTYPLVCDSDRAGSGVLHRDLIWQPPEVLFPCSACNGTGRYVGLIEVDTCKVCRGRKVVAG